MSSFNKVAGTIFWCLCYSTIYTETIKCNQLLLHPVFIGYNVYWELYFSFKHNSKSKRALSLLWFIYDIYYIVPLILSPGFYHGSLELLNTIFFWIGAFVFHLSVKYCTLKDAKYLAWSIDFLMSISLYLHGANITILLYKTLGDLFYAIVCWKSKIHIFHRLAIIITIDRKSVV